MTRSLLILLVFCFGISAESLADEIVNFAGSWDAPSSDVSAFSLDLTQTGNRIRGYHTAIAHRGKRIDAVLPSEGPPSITGIVTGGVAHIKFRSGYNDTGSGEALLTFRGNKLEWKITKSSGAHYFPESSVLFRQKRHQTKSPNHAMQLTGSALSSSSVRTRLDIGARQFLSSASMSESKSCAITAKPPPGRASPPLAL